MCGLRIIGIIPPESTVTVTQVQYVRYVCIYGRYHSDGYTQWPAVDSLPLFGFACRYCGEDETRGR